MIDVEIRDTCLNKIMELIVLEFPKSINNDP